MNQEWNGETAVGGEPESLWNPVSKVELKSGSLGAVKRLVVVVVVVVVVCL